MPLLTPTDSIASVHRPTASGCGLGVIAGLLAAAWSPHPDAWTVITVLLLLGGGWVTVATFLTHVGNAALACELTEPPVDFHALSSFPLRLRLVNAQRRWPALFLRSFVQVRGGGRLLPSPPFLTPQLGPRQSAEFDWSITACARGDHEICDLQVSSRFPGSLIVREQRFALEHRMLALPAIYRLHDRALHLLIGRRHATGRAHANPDAMEDFIGVRPYRPGDSPRHIHLITSLRMPDFPMELAVREFEDPSDDDVCVVLDTGIADDEQHRDVLLYRHEKSLSFCAALCRLLCLRKYRVRFRCLDANGQISDLLLQHPVKDLARLDARLARLQHTTNRPAIWRLLERQAGSSQSTVLFISLRELAEEDRHPRLAVLSITPDWQLSLIREVLSA